MLLYRGGMVMDKTFDADQLESQVREFCERAKIGFSCGGGTVRVLAGCALNYFRVQGINVPFQALVQIVNKAVRGCSGFYAGAFMEHGRGDASGFILCLERRGGC